MARKKKRKKKQRAAKTKSATPPKGGAAAVAEHPTVEEGPAPVAEPGAPPPAVAPPPEVVSAPSADAKSATPVEDAPTPAPSAPPASEPGNDAARVVPQATPRTDRAPPQPKTPEARTEDRTEELVEDLDADLDEDDASYESLVALVAGLPGEDRPAARTAPASAETEPDADVDEAIEVVDFDDEGSSEAIERLIAKAVVGAPVGVVEAEPEAPVIDLDADEPRPGTSAPAPVAGTTPTASEEAARLALAAARGGIDGDEVTSFSVDEDEVSTPEERARLLAAAMAHAEHQEARYRVPTDTGTARRWKAIAASLVLLLAGWVAAAPPGWVVPEPPAQLNALARARSIRTALLLQAQQVEAFRVETQRLPTTLDELPARLPGIAYTRSGNRAFQLMAYEPNGDAIIYDSANPMPAFRSLVDAWSAPEGTP